MSINVIIISKHIDHSQQELHQNKTKRLTFNPSKKVHQQVLLIFLLKPIKNKSISLVDGVGLEPTTHWV